MIVHVPITQEMIDTGVRNSCKDCPLAIGVRPYVKPGFIAHVTNKTIEFHAFPYSFARAPVAKRSLPYEAERFTREFDRGRNSRPCTLKIDFPSQLLQVVEGMVVDLVQELWSWDMIKRLTQQKED